MSIQAVAWVLEHSEATLADRLVLIAIANHADARGWNAYPAVDRLASEARVDRRTVFRAIEALEGIGEVTVQRRPGRPNMYGISALMGWQDVTPKGVAGSHPGVTSTAKRGGRLPPKPSLTVKEPSRARARGPITYTSPPPTLPPELDAETRARGAEWIRALRRGGEPA